MIVQAEHDVLTAGAGLPGGGLSALARAVSSASQATTLAGALEELVEAARVVSGAEVAVVRVRAAGTDRFEAVAVSGPAALAAELDGTFVAADEMPAELLDSLAAAPAAVRRAAARAGSRSVLVVPVEAGGTAAMLELYRAGGAFTPPERLGVELTASYAALTLRAFASGAPEALERPALELAGEALAAALDESHTAVELVRVAATIVGAPVGLLWEVNEDVRPPADGVVRPRGRRRRSRRRESSRRWLSTSAAPSGPSPRRGCRPGVSSRPRFPSASPPSERCSCSSRRTTCPTPTRSHA